MVVVVELLSLWGWTVWGGWVGRGGGCYLHKDGHLLERVAGEWAGGVVM